MITETKKCNCSLRCASWDRIAIWGLFLIGIVTICGGMVYYAWVMTTLETRPVASITSFEGCVAADNPVMESYPRQCRTTDGRIFVERTKLPEGQVCAQVITRAKNTATGEERDFPTPCAVPKGWEPVRATATTSQGILPYDSGVAGIVTLGPTCPVLRNPPDPACADKPYKTTVQAIRVGSPAGAPFATAETDAAGAYRFSLPPGSYAIQPIGGRVLPRCETKEITVEPGIVADLDLTCDSGIR